MSGVRGLFREAGRAGAFVRRLERALEPARRAAAASADWTLLREDERLQALTEPVDVSSALDGVMARLAATATDPAADEQIFHAPRRMKATTNTSGGHRRLLTGEASPAGRAARSLRADVERQAEVRAHARSTSSEGATKAGVPIVASDIAPSSTATIAPRVTGPAGRAIESPAGRLAAAPAPAADPIAFRTDAPIASHAPVAPLESDVSIAPNRIPYVSASRAAEILTERMRTSHTLHAFRSVVGTASAVSAGVENSVASAVFANPLTTMAVAPAAPVFDRAGDVAPAPVAIASDRRESRETATSASPATRPSRPTPIVDPTLTGLRRLAALATESLDDSRPDVQPVASPQPVANVEEELDRILRAEALRYGIPSDGLVR